MKKIGFIGCGNIAKAIFFGGINSGYIKGEDVFCFDLEKEKAEPFTAVGGTFTATANETAERSDVLFLTVKPQVFPGVIEGIKNSVTADTLIVTPAAGIKIERVRELFGFNLKVIRVMPNTPLMYSAGATAIVRGEGVEEDEFNLVKGLFETSGITAEVEEGMMDTVTAISGSSPAFFMRFAREIIKTGAQNGIDENKAKKLVLQTMLGTAKMALESENSLDELIKAVASPGGTTEAGLKTMDSADFDKTTEKIITSAKKRSEELG